jgi:hypothetical protein
VGHIRGTRPGLTPGPRGNEEDISGWETFHLVRDGHSSAIGDELNEAEFRAFQKEKRERLARKRPVGFAPWPED